MRKQKCKKYNEFLILFFILKYPTIESAFLFSMPLFQIVGDVKMIVLFCGKQRTEISNINTQIISLNTMMLDVLNLLNVSIHKLCALIFSPPIQNAKCGLSVIAKNA